MGCRVTLVETIPQYHSYDALHVMTALNLQLLRNKMLKKRVKIRILKKILFSSTIPHQHLNYLLYVNKTPNTMRSFRFYIDWMDIYIERRKTHIFFGIRVDNAFILLKNNGSFFKTMSACFVGIHDN